MESSLSTICTNTNCNNNYMMNNTQDTCNDNIKRNGKTCKSNKTGKSKRKSKKSFFSSIKNLNDLMETPDDSRLAHMRDQFLGIMNEKEALVSCGHQKDEEIRQLKIKIDELNDIINSAHLDLVGRGSDLFSSKIIELSKKNRQLFSEMESYKSKCSHLEAEICKLSENKIPENEQPSTPPPDDPTELELLRDKLTSTKAKLFNSMNENSQLKTELKLALKCLQQELGVPVVNIQSLTSTTSNWRGRAQQILTLQTKVSELSRKVEGTESNEVKLQNRLEFVRRCEVEELQKECNSLKETIDKLEFKLSATKARNKNLNDEATSYKLKTEELLSKCKDLDEYIKALNVSNVYN